MPSESAPGARPRYRAARDDGPDDRQGAEISQGTPTERPTERALIGSSLTGRIREIATSSVFNVAVMVLGVLVASGIAWFVDTRVTDLMLGQVAERAIDQVELGVQGHVTADDFTPPFSPAKLSDLAARLDPLVASVQRHGVIRLNVFARDGTIIYSDLPRLRGQKEPIDEELFQNALAGSIGREVSSLQGPENADLRARFDGALEVYVPVALRGQVVGVYEIYEDLSPVRPVRSIVWTSVLGALVSLFLLLLILAREAITRLHRQQQERERRLQQAAEAEALRKLDRLKSELLSAVSHELRTPLSIVHGYAELLMLRSDAFTPEQIREIAREINRGTSLMARIVDDLLDFHRIERGQLRLERQQIDLVAVIRETLQTLAQQSGAERVVLEAPMPVVSRADPARVSQIVANLVLNALRYAPTGPVTIRVAAQPEGWAMIEVRDQGPGISPEVLPHVWEMFYRAPEVMNSSIVGTGIGLALVKSLVEAHGGSVEATSVPNQGATFRVYLPLGREASISPTFDSGNPGAKTSGDTLSPMTSSTGPRRTGLTT